jgi:nucleoside-diphosphate-sugar epimerase
MSAAQVALVVGADGPVGRWVARSLCHEGWQVYATTRHADDVLFLRALGATVLSLDLASA